MPNKPLAKLKERIGESRETVTGFEIEPGKVEEFARAIKTNQDIYKQHQPGRAGDEVPAPLTYTRVSVFPRYRLTDSDGILGFDLGLELQRVVHGTQAYEFKRPVKTGDILTGVSTVTEVYEQESSDGSTMVFVTFETEYRNQDDDPVVTEQMTVIELESDSDSSNEGGENDHDDEP